MGPEHFWWGGWWLFPMAMPIFMVIVLVVVLYLFFGRGGVRPPWWSDADRPPAETAMEVLKKRYAKGEITKAEFDRIKQDIS